jgi:hypothetical protein
MKRIAIVGLTAAVAAVSMLAAAGCALGSIGAAELPAVAPFDTIAAVQTQAFTEVKADFLIADLTEASALATPVISASMQPVAGYSAQSLSKTVDLYALASAFKVKTGTYYNTVGYSTNHYKYTSSELTMLAVVIHLEARGQPYKAKLAVANVVMNRVLAPGYPGSTIKAVVTQPNQFCYNASVQPNADCLRAAKDVLDNEVWVVPQNVYFFRATKSKSNWGKTPYWGHIGDTAFYRGSYAGRYNGSSIPAKLYSRTYKWPQVGCAVGSRVRKVQLMLNALGYRTAVDGYFGESTKAALIRFQKKAGLAPDGIAGSATLKVLIRKYGVNRYLKL